MLVLREVSSPEGVGPESVEEEKDREGKPSGAASETSSSADGGIGSPIGEQSLRTHAAILQDCPMIHWLQRQRQLSVQSTFSRACARPQQARFR